MSCVMCKVSHVRCQVSGVRCRMSRVTYHLSLTPTATVTATDPPPANSLIMQSWLLRKDPKTQNNIKNAKKIHKTKITPKNLEVRQY